MTVASETGDLLKVDNPLVQGVDINSRDNDEAHDIGMLDTGKKDNGALQRSRLLKDVFASVM